MIADKLFNVDVATKEVIACDLQGGNRQAIARNLLRICDAVPGSRRKFIPLLHPNMDVPMN